MRTPSQLDNNGVGVILVEIGRARPNGDRAANRLRGARPQRWRARKARACLRLTSTCLMQHGEGYKPYHSGKGDEQRSKRFIGRHELVTQLLPSVPARYRALVALAGGTGLRWGECAGLRWDAVDLAAGVVRVVRVAVEVSGHVSDKPYPKSRAGRRVVPLPPFVVGLLAAHRRVYADGRSGMAFTSRSGEALRRGTFRARIWRPSLVRAGLLGMVVEVGKDRFTACWQDRGGVEQSKEFTTRPAAIAHIVKHAHGGIRFHDLRHSYATWLVSAGVPINDVSAVMGHEQTSTTLDRYTHPSQDKDRRVRSVFADFLLTPAPDEDPESDE
jgi:integrase